MERNLAYVPGTDRSQRFDLYYSAAAANAAPFVVFIHGGGFIEGDKAAIAGGEHPAPVILSELMTRGYVVASSTTVSPAKRLSLPRSRTVRQRSVSSAPTPRGSGWPRSVSASSGRAQEATSLRCSA
jgi:hypothetical protein